MSDERRDRLQFLLAWAAWVAMLVVVCVLVVQTLRSDTPTKNSVTFNFRDAAAAWRAGQPMYNDGENGFLYLPQSAILYVPFTWGPIELGEVLWRVVGTAIFATGLWRAIGRFKETDPAGADARGLDRIVLTLARRICGWIAVLRPDGRGGAFLAATLMCLALAESNARNGQHNLPLAGLMLHAAVDLSRSRWWSASLCLCLMTALKPLGIVMVLLAAVVYPATAWRMAIGLVGVALLPFIHPNTTYAMEQYRGAFSTMESARKVEMPRGQDLRGIFTALGVTVAPAVLTAVRAAAAPLMLGIAWLGKRRWSEPRGAFCLLAAAALYLSLFNPRAEGLTYVVLSPVVAILALNARVRAVGLILLILAIAIAGSQSFTGGVNTWMRPTAAILLLGWIIADLARVLGRVTPVTG